MTQPTDHPLACRAREIAGRADKLPVIRQLLLDLAAEMERLHSFFEPYHRTAYQTHCENERLRAKIERQSAEIQTLQEEIVSLVSVDEGE